MELATPGRVNPPPVPTLIREGRMRLEKCFGSFAGAVAELVGIDGGVVSGVINLEIIRR